MVALFHYLLSLLLLPLCMASNYVGYYCGGVTPSDDNRTAANIRRTLDAFVADTKISDFGGGAFSNWGEPPGNVYGLMQCRGDTIGTANCTACVLAAVKALPTVCPAHEVDARIWYDYCFMRYDVVDFFGKPDFGYSVVLVNVDTSMEPRRFDRAAGRVVRMAAMAAVKPGNLLLGRAEAAFRAQANVETKAAINETLYGLAQCTRDLKPEGCSRCLEAAMEALPSSCQSRIGCQINYSSCTVRYEIYRFYSSAN